MSIGKLGGYKSAGIRDRAGDEPNKGACTVTYLTLFPLPYRNPMHSKVSGDLLKRLARISAVLDCGADLLTNSIKFFH